MNPLSRCIHSAAILLLGSFTSATSIGQINICPLGFTRILHDDRPLCYRKKDSEAYSDFYKDCSNNMFSSKLYSQLHIDKSEAVWTEYKNEYPRGPLLDTLSESLQELYPVTVQNQILKRNKFLCIVTDGEKNLAVGCEGKYPRYCIIKPLVVDDNKYLKEECKHLKDSFSFSSPEPICFTVVTLESIEQRKNHWKTCEQKGVSLINKGWRYESFENKFVPSTFIALRYLLNDSAWGPELQKKDIESYSSASDFDKDKLICGFTYIPKNVSMELKAGTTKVTLKRSEIIAPENLRCFTDSTYPSPKKVEITHSTSVFQLESKNSGYYWCQYRDPITSNTIRSDKVLFINNGTNTSLTYAVKFLIRGGYDKDNFFVCRNMVEIFLDKLSKRHKVIKYYQLKRKYLDGKKLLLYHLELDHIIPKYKIYRIIKTSSFKMVEMRNVIYCNGVHTERIKPIDEAITDGCTIKKCTGDFNEGYELLTAIIKNCTHKVSTMKQVSDALQSQLSRPVHVENIPDILHQLDTVLGAGKNLEDSGRMLHLLDQLGSTVKLQNSSSMAKVVTANVAFVVGDTKPSLPIWGFRLHAPNNSHFTNDSFSVIRQKLDASNLESSKEEVVVLLPSSVATSVSRVSFVAFRDDRAFISSPDHSHVKVLSHVISINVNKLKRLRHGEEIVIHFTPITANVLRNESRSCAYWHFTGDDNKTGYWSQDGCTFIRATRPGLLDTCRCDHLTHFAKILVPRAVFSERDEAILEIITIVGCSLSIFGLAVIVSTAVMFRTWRQVFNNKIWLQLCISIFVMIFCFLIIVSAKFDHYNIPCVLIGIALHYSVLCSLCWMFIAAVMSYRNLVLVYTTDVSHRLLKVSVFSYGVPCLVIGIILAVDLHAYSFLTSKIPYRSFCYLSGLAFWIAIYGPIAAVLFVNLILFIRIFYSVFVANKIQRYGCEANEALKCVSVSCLLVFLFGLPWVTGLLADNIVFAYMFTLLASLQGFILFVFFVLGKTQTRNMWLHKLNIKSTRKAPLMNPSSTTVNKDSQLSKLGSNSNLWVQSPPSNTLHLQKLSPHRHMKK